MLALGRQMPSGKKETESFACLLQPDTNEISYTVWNIQVHLAMDLATQSTEAEGPLKPNTCREAGSGAVFNAT